MAVFFALSNCFNRFVETAPSKNMLLFAFKSLRIESTLLLSIEFTCFDFFSNSGLALGKVKNFEKRVVSSAISSILWEKAAPVARIQASEKVMAAVDFRLAAPSMKIC